MIIIKDISPQAPVHLLMIPRTHYAGVNEMSESESAVLGRCFYKLGRMEDKLGLTDGYRTIINRGSNGGQTVMHLHVHILGGKKLGEKMLQIN